MGKSIVGKELGEGITQRSDGLFVVRFRCGNGKREQKVFKDLNSAKQWILDRKFQFSHQVPETFKGVSSDFSEMTVAGWYDFWNETYNRDLSPNTVRNYHERYIRNKVLC